MLRIQSIKKQIISSTPEIALVLQNTLQVVCVNISNKEHYYYIH